MNLTTMSEMRNTFNHPSGRNSLFNKHKTDELLSALNSTLDSRGLVYAASRQSNRKKLNHLKRTSVFSASKGGIGMVTTNKAKI